MNLSSVFLVILIVLSICNNTNSQNTKELPYNTVYLEDLCRELANNKDILLLDVRSKGEYDDTSNVHYLNVGRFKNAVNIDISNIENRLGELKEYKDKDIYVYCSHSNRSRVVSKLLVDSGFTKVTNVNGGISTWVHDEIDCNGTLYSNSLPYKLYSPKKVRTSLSDNNTIIIDIRPRDEYEGKSDKEIRNIGRIKNVINIPSGELEGRLGEIDKNKKVILLDFDCSLSPKAAAMLVKKGYADVGIMVYGLFSWVTDFGREPEVMENTPAYSSVTPAELCGKINNKDMLILDVRTASEYGDKNEMEHMNIGHLKNAVNIPANDVEGKASELEGSKDKEILIYDFGREGKASETAKMLSKKGFTKISILHGGLYSIVWRQKNIKNFCMPSEYIVH